MQKEYKALYLKDKIKRIKVNETESFSHHLKKKKQLLHAGNLRSIIYILSNLGATLYT